MSKTPDEIFCEANPGSWPRTVDIGHERAKKKPVPHLQLLFQITTGDYAIANFDEIDMWAVCNDPLYHQLTMECRQRGIWNEDRLKLILVALLREKHHDLSRKG